MTCGHFFIRPVPVVPLGSHHVPMRQNTSVPGLLNLHYASSVVSSTRVTAMDRSSSCLSSAPQNAGVLRDPTGLKVLGGSEFRLRKFSGFTAHRIYGASAAPSAMGPVVDDLKIYSASEVSSIRVTAMDRSSSCLSSTTSGQAIIRSEAFCTLGKAMTSRMEDAPAISMHSRSRP